MSYQSGSTRFRELFESALQAYEKNTGISLPEHPITLQLKNCSSVESITVHLQDQLQLSSDCGGSDRVKESIRSTISVLSTLSINVALDCAIGLAFSLEDAIHAGIAILLTAAKGVISSCDALVDLLESIECFVRCLGIYTQVPHTTALDEVLVRILMELLSIFALATKAFEQGQSTIFKMKRSREDVDAVLQRLDRLTEDEARMTAAEIFKVVYRLVQNMTVVMNDDEQSSICGVQETLELLHNIASAMNKSKRDELQRDIRNWLSPPDPWKNHHIACESRHEGTAAWFVQGNTFSEWKASGPSSLLWIHGKPGSGKSVLCSTIIKEVEAMRKCGLASLAFYYYDFRDDEKKDRRGLLSSVLFQLCDQSDSYHNTLAAFYAACRHGTQSPSDDELARCLKDLLKHPGQAPVYIIIDALDECPNTSDLLSPREKVIILLEDLIDSKLPNLRVCITSRPEADIKLVLQPLIFRSVSIHDESGQMMDIENYIKWTVNSNRKMRRWKSEHRQLVIDVLTRRADGMFRWVYCQLGYLSDCLPGRIRHALDELPETLNGTYERTLREIKTTNWEFARRLFLCVAVASRPLRVEELAEFLAFDFDAGQIPKLREDWRLEDPLEAVLSTCSTLLALVNVEDSPVIQFSHFSVKEFLTSSRLVENCDAISSRYHVSMTPAHTLVAQACLGVLLHLDKTITENILKKYPLAEYAAEHWFEHARFEGVSTNTEDGMRQLFDPSQAHLAVWVWIRDPIPWTGHIGAERPSRPRVSPIHYAAFCGLPSIVKFLAIEHRLDVNSRALDDNRTPLHLASGMGHVEVARVLVEQGADKEAKDKDGSIPLHHAVEGGSVDLTRLLVEHGPVVMDQNRNGLTPLHLAVKGGNVDLVRLLIENHGANATAQDKDGWTPLHFAAQQGSVDLTRLLVEHGPVVMDQNRNGSTPLHLAVKRGNVDLVRLLIENHGANATAQDKDGWTPLHFAAQQGSVDLTRLLVEHGPVVMDKNRNGSTPLHLAVKGGSVDLVRLLIENHGADVTAHDKDGWTPLHFAVQQGSVDLTRLFVENGADATAHDKYGWTPLHSAVWAGRADLIRCLFEHGANPSVKDKYHKTPLHMALRQGSMELTRVLVEHGADMTDHDEDGRTPLHLVALCGRVDLAGLLLGHGADTTAQDQDGRSPLHLAALAGSIDVARLLVGHDANVTTQDQYGLTPLQLASQEGNVDLERFLVEHGARYGHGLLRRVEHRFYTMWQSIPF